jgi:hypothetical protein
MLYLTANKRPNHPGLALQEVPIFTYALTVYIVTSGPIFSLAIAKILGCTLARAGASILDIVISRLFLPCHALIL